MMNYKETLFFIGKCLTINYEKHNKTIVEEKIKLDKVDWDNVVKLSTKHYVFPALYCNLKRADFLHYLPSDLVEYMKHITDLNRQRNLKIIEQAKEINDLLLKNNITPIFLKGTGNLLEGLYKDIAERMVGDIDFIVSKDEFQKTVLLLKENNYKKTSDSLINPIISKHYPRLFNENKTAAVEIHLEMVRDKLSLSFNYNNVFKSILKKDNFSFLSYKDQLTLTILASQHNDFGSYYKNLSLRNTYDSYLLSRKTQTINNCTKKIFNLLNSYLAISSLVLNSHHIPYKNNLRVKIYYLIVINKINYPIYNKVHSHFWKLYLYAYFKLRGLERFLFNKEFRKYYIKKLSNS